MKLQALTSLRFFFAFMVFLCHLTYFRDSGIPMIENLLEKYLRYGYLGVNFFFMLSGFVMAFTYASAIAEQQFSKKEFLIKRAIRIVPLHYFTLLLITPVVVKSVLEDGGFTAHHTFQFLVKFGAHLTLTQSFIPAIPYYFSFNNPAWSISAEMFFYLMFPAIVAFIFRKGLIRSYGFYLFLLGVALVLMTAIRNFYDPQWLFYINPFIRILDFMMGIFLFFFYSIIRHSNRMNPSRASILQIISLIVPVVFFMGIENVFKAYSNSLYFYIPMALLIFSFAFSEGSLAKLISVRPLIFLGEASYSFYLTQDITARYMNWNGTRHEIIREWFAGNYLAYAAVQLVIALLVAIIVHLYVEEPLTKWLKTKYEKRQTVRSA
ncbi:MAG: acyltransferase [Bacteroidetes bacterium]|nr:acyltransferase [Bacteroidota bacterium]